MSNSYVDSTTVATAAVRDYDIQEPSACTLIRQGFNDHYLLQTPSGRYVCRVYLNGKYYIGGTDAFRFELELLDFLRGRGCGVASPLRRRDGALLGSLSDTGRSFALFTYAEGEQIQRPGAAQSWALGAELARIHLAADDFACEYERYHLGTDLLLDRPLRLIERERAAGNDELAELFRAIDAMPPMARLRETLHGLPRSSGGYGLIHADPHLANVHLDGNGPTFFDFDHCAYGWRAYDLATLVHALPEETQPNGIGGYESVRPLAPAERAALPLLRHIRRIWDTGDILAMQPVWDTRR